MPPQLPRRCHRSRYHADAPFAMNVAGHDADLDLVWRDSTGAVRPEQQRLPALHAVTRANHVTDRDTLGDANHQIELRVDGFVDRCRRKRRWYIDDADRRAGGLLSFAYRRINRNALEVLARLFRIDPGDEALPSVGIIAAHASMELAGFAGDSLRDHLGILLDQNAHSIPSCRRSRAPSSRHRVRWRVALRRAAVPPCVVLPHGVAAGLEGMAAVELERLGVVLYLAPQSGESLYRRGGRLRQQLRNVAASAHAAHRSEKRFAKTVQQV